MGWFTRSEHPEEQLSAFIDGELDARQAEKVARHLAACPQCTTLVDELRSAKTMLSELPREAPRRSFVLGPEHARQPVAAKAPTRRSSFSFAPAVAATLLIGLLLADAVSFSGVSNDESSSGGAAGASKSEFSRQSAEDSSAEAPVPAVAPSQSGPATANSGSAADAAGTPATAPSVRVPELAGSPVPQVGGGTASESTGPQAPPAPTVMLPPATGDNAPAATGPLSTLGTDSPPTAGERDGFADNAAASEDDGSGLSTLRVLQILAAIALVASVFYVYVRPRLFERK